MFSFSSRASTLALAVVLVYSGPAVAHAQAPAPRVEVSVNGAGQTGSTHFQRTAVIRSSEEDGSLASTYAIGSGPVLDVGGSVRVWRHVSAGVSVSRFTNTNDALVTALVPHPFFFNQLRTVSGATPGARRQETAVHVEAAWAIPVGKRFELKLFGGPSVIQVRQDLVSDVTYTETYPYQTATFESAPLSRQSKSAIAMNAGIDLSMSITRFFGVGGLVRYSRATVDLPAPSGDSVSVKAGGLHAGGGIRLRF